MPEKPVKSEKQSAETAKQRLARISPFSLARKEAGRRKRRVVGQSFESPINSGAEKDNAISTDAEFRQRWSNGF